MKKVTANKGVTATTKDITETLKRQPNRKNGIENIKEELANVIELMGPSTPHLIPSSSNEGKEEESYVTSIYSSVVEVKRSLKESQSTPRDMSEMSALPIDISETTDSTKIIENPNVHLGHHDEKCPYRDYLNAINTFSQNLKPAKPKIHTFEKVNVQKMVEIKNNKESRFSFLNLLKFRRHEKDLQKEPIELYKINIQQNDDENIPNKLTFDLIHDIPKPITTTVATNTSRAFIAAPVHFNPCRNQENQSVGVTPVVNIAQVNTSFKPPKSGKQSFLNDKPTRVDVYYFDHGNACYLKTTDVVPNLATELIAEKTEAYTTKFWAELFGTIHIFFAFLTTFILQLLKFFLQSLIRPLTIGLLQLSSDYFFKPCLSVVFNSIIQPPAIFCFNILTSLRDLCDPVAEGIGYFLREVANVCRSIRLVEVKNNTNNNKPQLNKIPFRRSRIRRK